MVRSHGHGLSKQGDNIDVAGIVDALINRLIELPKIIYCSVFVCKGQEDELKRKTTKGNNAKQVVEGVKMVRLTINKFTSAPAVDDSETEDADSEQPPDKRLL